jgi:hypothetical protein
VNSYGDFVGFFLRSFVALVAGLWTFHAAWASAVQIEASVPKDLLYLTAKSYVLSQLGGGKIALEDLRAGLLRFRFRDGNFSDEGAVIEVIDLDPTHSRLRVTIPADFSGRDQLLADTIAQIAKRIHEGREGREVRFDAKRAFQTVRRHILKRFVGENQKREKVIRVDDDEIGLLGFVYSEDGFVDRSAAVQVIPTGDQVSRLVVTLPMDPTVRRSAFENELIRVISEDLAENGRKDSKPQ